VLEKEEKTIPEVIQQGIKRKIIIVEGAHDVLAVFYKEN